jgi:hypothetical protein
MSRVVLFLVALLALARAGEEGARFDGRTLDGWKVQGAPYWKVVDGVLVGESDAAKKNSILWSKERFRDFAVEVEYRISEGHDSGIFLRHFNDQIQIGVSPSLKRDVTGSPYIGSKRGYPEEAADAGAVLKPGDWNRLRIEARGTRYQVWLNGFAVLDYVSETAKEKGPIGLQVHPGMKMKIEFREVVVEGLE